MQPASACVGPAASHTYGIVGENRFIVHLALTQTDAFSIFEIDCGYEKHQNNSSGVFIQST